MQRCGKSLAIILAMLPSMAFASTDGSTSSDGRHPFETCVMTKALTLEPSGAQISQILANAERACRDSKGGLAKAAVSEIASKVRLAVMQQRTNALNTRRRG
jgi:hypothetical protein